MTLTCTGLPKATGTLVVKNSNGFIVVQKNEVSDVCKTASSVKRKLETGAFTDASVQEAYNADPEGFTFEARAFDPSAELAVEAEVMASEALMDSIQETHVPQNLVAPEQPKKATGMTRAEREVKTREEATRLGFFKEGVKWADAYAAMQEFKKANGFLGKPFGTAQR